MLLVPLGGQLPGQNLEGMIQAAGRENHEGSHLEGGLAGGSSSRTDSHCIEGGACHRRSCCDALAGTLGNDDQTQAAEGADSRGDDQIVQEADTHFRRWARHTADPGGSHG